MHDGGWKRDDPDSGRKLRRTERSPPGTHELKGSGFGAVNALLLGRQTGSAYVDVALVEELTCLDDVFEIEPAAGTFEAAGAAAAHNGMLAASVDL